MRSGTRGCSQAVVENSGFLWSFHRYLWEPLELYKGSQTSFKVSRGDARLLSRHCRGKGPHLVVRGESRGFLKVRLEGWGSSWVATGTSGSLSCCLREFKSPLELWGVARDSSPVTAGEYGLIYHWGGILWCFSSCRGKFCVPLELRWGPQELQMLPQGSQASFQVSRGTSGFLSSRCMKIGPHLELKWETQCVHRVAKSQIWLKHLSMRAQKLTVVGMWSRHCPLRDVVRTLFPRPKRSGLLGTTKDIGFRSLYSGKPVHLTVNLFITYITRAPWSWPFSLFALATRKLRITFMPLF